MLVDAADESAPFDMNEEFTSAAQRMAQCARRHLWVVMLMVPPFSMLLALAVHLTEPDWHFLEALYYTFISLSTIGLFSHMKLSHKQRLLWVLSRVL